MRLLLLFLVGSLFAADNKPALPPNVRQMLDRISPDSMKGNLSFLASDLLEGRATPSRGLDLAAEFIASQYRRAGLEPGGDEGYFQTAKYKQIFPASEGLSLKVTNASGKSFEPAAVDLVARSAAPYSGANLKILKLPRDHDKWKEEEVEGKAVLLAGPMMVIVRSLDQVAKMKPAVILLADSNTARFLARPQLVDASQAPSTPMLAIKEKELVDALKEAPEGDTGFTLSVSLPASKIVDVALRNVVAMVRGSDPVLNNTAIVVSAHYDHIGLLPPGDGDRINNGANDDGSGTVSVIEIATAMAKMNPRPRRSVVFVTFFGEEIGGYGSRWFAAHTPIPLKNIIANINLEQVGRTDSSDGPQINTGSFTGFDFTDMPQVFAKAGKLLGVNIYKDEKRSDPFFGRSDNQFLADAGVPAHTLCVAFEYPDYHRPGDHWEKVDYENMARVDRAVAAGVWMLAESEKAPKWNESNPKTKSYVEAAKKLK